jgi:glutamate 5-kinase
MTQRAAVAKARRIVVKIGSRALSSPGAHEALAADVAALCKEKRCVVIVSSGAIAHGMAKLRWRKRPKEIAKLQAAAAAGQSLLMHAYEEAFDPHGIPIAQVLLTHADLADRARANNAREALAELLAAGAVPILNENDSVAVEEIKFGDNDQLAAMVTPLVDADLLVLLSDVEGVLDGNGKRIPIVRHDDDVGKHIRKGTNDVGTGGMASKVEAARRAALAGANVVIAESGTLGIAHGDDIGTLFVAAETRMSARKYWIAFTLRPRGDLVLDRGAAHAVRTKSTSLLSVGVLGVRGHFSEGDAVRLLDPEGAEIARGLVRLNAEDAARAAGTKSAGVLVHRDELVLL